ncbi:MAG TPA: site-2 protease family protein [Bacteroidales bacterium]|nr:site-2 protease family protein [Bacteroidales bacterium]HCI56093.1 site-2 protease family protein [Bacteroidales bacterium]HOU95118.1 site-2 protease family protein [Bacteroidales bacterium]HQG36392.1 site-2 protease family protein [Bacteroidales bacterium]HQG53719.1 site-2 protease family protein [Bacteroidales bacterium]
MAGFDILYSLKLLPGIIIGLTVHEFSHAFIAQRCGDNTSAEQGRVTLNPLKHIDLLGFLMLFIAGFGWAKPVQFNEMNLRNPKIDVLKIAVAGPLSNAITAMLLSVIFVVFKFSFGIAGELIIYAIFINWGLFIFNLIPIPPLDGSHLLFQWFKKYPEVYNAIYKYGTIALFILLILAIGSNKNLLPIGSLIEFISKGFLKVLGYYL